MRKGVHVLWALTLTAGVAGSIVTACTGDDPVAPPASGPIGDGGTVDDGMSIDGASGDAAPADAGGDAQAAKPCDPAGPFTLVEEVTVLNGGGGAAVDKQARLAPDELTAYWISDRGGPPAIFAAKRGVKTGTFTGGAPAGIAPGSNALFNGPTVGDDATRMYFGTAINGINGFTEGLQKSVFADGGWSSPVFVVTSTTSIKQLRSPYLKPDGLRLVFDGTDDRDGGTREVLYESVRSGTDLEFQSRKVIEELSDTSPPSDQASPVLSADGLTIYFASNVGKGTSPGALADKDIYVATRSSLTSPFTGRTVLPSVSNVDFDDEPSWISPDYCTLYLTSDHKSDPGGSKIFRATRPPPN